MKVVSRSQNCCQRRLVLIWGVEDCFVLVFNFLVGLRAFVTLVRITYLLTYLQADHNESWVIRQPLHLQWRGYVDTFKTLGNVPTMKSSFRADRGLAFPCIARQPCSTATAHAHWRFDGNVSYNRRFTYILIVINPVMLSPRGQSGIEAKIFASASASKLWPRPRPQPRSRGFGLGLASISLSYYVIGHFSC